MKPEDDHLNSPIPAKFPTSFSEAQHPGIDARDEIRTTTHRVMGSRESQRPAERSDQNRRHGRHAGPRKSEPKK